MTSSLCRIKNMLFLALIGLAMQASASMLTAPRAGDAIDGCVLAAPYWYGADTCGILDLSGLRPMYSVDLQVEACGKDSVFVNAEGVSRLVYNKNGQSYIGSVGRNGLFSLSVYHEYESLPDSTEVLNGIYFRLGQWGNADYQEYGRTSIVSLPLKQIVTMDGDTLSHCWLERSTRTGALGIKLTGTPIPHPEPPQLTDSVKSALLAYRPEADSLCRTVCRERYYAAGYRYPIFEIERQALLSYGIPYDSICHAIAYHTSSQEELDDEPNEEIRRMLKERPEQSEWLLVRRNAPAHNSDSQTSLTLRISPSVTNGPLTAEIFGASEDTQLRVYSSAGTCLQSYDISCEKEGHRATLDISQFQPGIYIIAVYSEGSDVSSKVFRK